MAIVVTQNWSGSRLVKESRNWTAQESWVVTGVASKGEAEDAAVAHGAAHVENPNMVVHSRDGVNLGPLVWRVTADFKFGDPGICALTPLDEDPQLIWEFSRITSPIDTDQDANSIVNSAGAPVEGLTDNFPITALIVRRAEPFFNVSKALNYMDAVNNDAFTIAGAGGVDPGYAYCDYIRPCEFYTLRAPWVWVEYRFEFLTGSGLNPWQTIIVDKGQWGWWASGKRGPFCGSDGTPVNFDVLLDGTGKPLDSSFKVLDDTGTPQTAIANPGGVPPGFQLIPSWSSTNQKSAVWYTKRRISFAGLI